MIALYRHIRSHTPPKLNIDACLRLLDVDRAEYDTSSKQLWVWVLSLLKIGPGQRTASIDLRLSWDGRWEPRIS